MGQGSYGQVWSALQLSTQQPVAIKLLTQFSLELEREVERLRQVSEHPYVVGLLDANLDHQPPFLVMPLLQRSLSGAVGRAQDHPKISLSQMVTWLEQAAGALRYVHNRGLLHCDLKPANLLIDSNGDLRVADFGQAFLENDLDQRLGTLFYMPPEQALLEPRAVPSAGWDIYALGATFYQLLCGRLPRAEQELQEALSELPSTREVLEAYSQRLSQQPLIPLRRLNPQVDPDLAAIVEHCLAIPAEGRYADMGGLLEDLRRRKLRLPLSCRPARPLYLTRLFLQRHAAAVAVSLVASVVLAGTVTLAFQRVGRERAEAMRQAAQAREALAGLSSLQASQQEGPEALLNAGRAVDQSLPGTAAESLRRVAFHLRLQSQPKLLRRIPNVRLADDPDRAVVDPAGKRLLISNEDSGRVGWLSWETGERDWLPDAMDRLEQAQFGGGRLVMRAEQEVKLSAGDLDGENFEWMSLDPQGRVLALGSSVDDSRYQQVHLLDGASGKSLGGPLTVEGQGLLQGQFSQDGAYFALLDQGNQVHLFGLRPPRRLWSTETDEVVQVAFSGSQLLLRCRYSLKVRRLSDGKPISPGLTPLSGVTCALVASPAGALLSFPDWLLAYHPGQEQPDLVAQPAPVCRMAFGGPERLALGCTDGSVRLYAGELKRPVGCVQADGPVQWLGFDSGQLVAFCAQPADRRQGTLWCWQWPEPKRVGAQGEVRLLPGGTLSQTVYQPWEGKAVPVPASSLVRQTPAGLILADTTGQVLCLDPQSGQVRSRTSLPITPGAIRPDGKAALLGQDAHSWQEVSLPGGRLLRQDPKRAVALELPQYSSDGTRAVALAPEVNAAYQLFFPVPIEYHGEQALREVILDGDNLLARAWDRVGQPGVGLAWKLGEPEPVARFPQSDLLASMLLNREKTRLLTASREGTVALWDFPARGQAVPRLRMHHDYALVGAAFSPDEKFILSWGVDGETRLWDAQSGLPLCSVLPGSPEVEPTFTSLGELVTWVNGQARKWSLQPWRGANAEATARSQTGL